MTGYDLGALGVGKTLTTREFTVRPADLTAHVEAVMLEGAGSAQPALWGRVCPNSLAIDRVLAALAEHEALRDLDVIVRSVGRVRALGELMIGASITASAEVRFRSERNPGCTHLTVEVEVHHWRDGHRSRLLSFEAGLELHAATMRTTARAVVGPAAA